VNFITPIAVPKFTGQVVDTPWMDLTHRAPSRWLAALAIAVAALLAAGPAGAATTSTPKPAAGATLSNLRTLTRWAYPQATSAAHATHSFRSRVVGHLVFLSPDEQAEIYLALHSWTDPRHHRTWIQVPIPGRPNGNVGWVPSTSLGPMHIVRENLVINRETLRATLFDQGRPIFSAPVGVGRPSLPTPGGQFYILEKLMAIGGPAYGPYAFATSAYAPTLSEWPGGGVVGIHGTDQPELIPGYPSHGCIRMKNADITRLWRLMSIGTPVHIV
jgi:hypothetical protein